MASEVLTVWTAERGKLVYLDLPSFIHLGKRVAVVAGATSSPNMEWVKWQSRTALMGWLSGV